MHDREKVIKALEMCETKNECVLCPYTDWCGDYEDYAVDCTSMLAKDARVLLKEQEKTPVVFSQDDGSVTTACGNCGWGLDKAYSRCPKCQKELDWNALQE